VSYTAITPCVASQRVFIVIVVILLSTQSGNFRIHLRTVLIRRGDGWHRRI